MAITNKVKLPTRTEISPSGPVQTESLQELLRELGGDKQFLSSLVELFFERAPRAIANLESAYQARNLRALEYESHTLKSSCAHMGALSLRQLCEEIEVSSRSGSLEEISTFIESLRQQYPAVESALRKYIETLK